MASLKLVLTHVLVPLLISDSETYGIEPTTLARPHADYPYSHPDPETCDPALSVSLRGSIFLKNK